MVNGSRRTWRYGLFKQTLLHFLFTCYLISFENSNIEVNSYRNLHDNPVPSPIDWVHLPLLAVVAISTITDIGTSNATTLIHRTTIFQQMTSTSALLPKLEFNIYIESCVIHMWLAA